MRLTLSLDPLFSCRVDAIVRRTGADITHFSVEDVLPQAGPEAIEACRELRRLGERAGLPLGRAVSTAAGSLPARWLIHVHGPAFDVRHSNEHLLRLAYRSVLAAADAVGAETVAMRPLGTTEPYWPLETAIRAATGVLPNTPTGACEVRLVLKTAAGLEPFAEALARR